MGARVTHTLDDLESDMRTIATTFKARASVDVRGVATDGNRAARRLARRSAGSHGKHYFKAFTTERKSPLWYEWGPDSAMPQGGMSFERGSRNQAPHHDIAQGADLHGADDLARRTRRTLDDLFWPS